jgi:hypothetical protein
LLPLLFQKPKKKKNLHLLDTVIEMVVCGFETKGKLWLSNSILTPPKQQLFNQIYSRCFKSLSGISNPTIFILHSNVSIWERERERERGVVVRWRE